MVLGAFGLSLIAALFFLLIMGRQLHGLSKSAPEERIFTPLEKR